MRLKRQPEVEKKILTQTGGKSGLEEVAKGYKTLDNQDMRLRRMALPGVLREHEACQPSSTSRAGTRVRDCELSKKEEK